jgi:hypothetical protein
MGVFGWIRTIITLAIAIGVLLAVALAVVDAIRRPAASYEASGKRTKRFWLLVLAAGTLFAVLGALQMVGIMLNIIAIIPAAIYWYDVRPAIVSGRRGTSRFGSRSGSEDSQLRFMQSLFGSFDSAREGSSWRPNAGSSAGPTMGSRRRKSKTEIRDTNNIIDLDTRPAGISTDPRFD